MEPTTLDTIKGLSIHQHESGYRFSMDAVLLATYVHMQRAERVLDIGSGSGIVGLLLARRYEGARVTLLELQEGLYELAKRNIEQNGLTQRVEVIQGDLREMPAGLRDFDLVVSNPPFRRPESGRLSEGGERSIARHELTMTLEGLLRAAAGALRQRGRFVMVYSAERLADVMSVMRQERIEPKCVRFAHGRVGSEARMVLVEGVKDGSPGVRVEAPLIIYEEDGQTYTPEVLGFYLP